MARVPRRFQPGWIVLPLLCVAAIPLPALAQAMTPRDLSSPSHTIVPAPVSADFARDRSFTLGRRTRIAVPRADPDVQRVAELLAARLRPATGFALPVDASGRTPTTGTITLRLEADASAFGDEGYRLTIAPDGVTIVAREPAGLFYGTQTLRQLLPAEIERPTLQRVAWRLPLGTVTDQPRFAWRGAMLDVARHFFDVATVRQYVDLLAKYKINRLHLHLSDDQGWRLEIKSWPLLTSVGALSAVGGGPGGFYTQEDYAALVAYARDRFITVVPEIDVPGHTNAALVSYAELNCDGIAPKPHTGIEVGFSALCVDRDVTYRFLDDVIREIAAITPGPYFHIGGDEVEKLTDEQYGRFIERVQDLVHKHGKRLVGWEEVTKAALAPTSLVQMWRSGAKQGPPPWRTAAAGRALQLNVPLIVSPASKAYLDMKYDASTPLGLNWAGTIEVRDAYEWDPGTAYQAPSPDADAGAPAAMPQVAGVEAPLWTETLVTLDDLEFMAFPRLAAIAEVAWSPQAARSWDDFRLRLAAHGPRWAGMGVDFYLSPQVPWPEDATAAFERPGRR
jgi:hexosaminidase